MPMVRVVVVSAHASSRTDKCHLLLYQTLSTQQRMIRKRYSLTNTHENKEESTHEGKRPSRRDFRRLFFAK